MSSSQSHPGVALLRPYLLDCGYRTSQLARNIEVENGHRYTVPLAAFAHSPHDSRSACIAVIEGASDPEEAVVSCRGLGAPLVFLYFPDRWQLWQQSTTRPKPLRQIPPEELPSFFLERKEKFAPEAVYRAKTWARLDTSYQLDFVDAGLMPLVEEEAGRKLTELIERVVQEAKSRLHWDEISQQQGQWLLQSHFWLLAAKILKDKNVPTFAALDLENLQDVFAHVADHYGANTPVRVGTNPQVEALRESAQEISRFSHLGLVSTDALAYLYEHALITPEVRAALGTYSTPTYLVDYIIGKLRPWIEDIPVRQRQVFEPACGHAAFLLAAMQLLGDLLPEGMSSPRKRHQYLRTRLHGYDIDPFALEIARLGLTLADAPNPNGWDLQVADMFEVETLARHSQEASIILANPPFKNLPAAERRQTSSDSVPAPYVNTTAEVLHRVATSMQPGAVFGMIVPQGLLYSRNATSLRQFLATDFEIGEICLLPDKVFTSDAESAVLLGRRLQSGQQNQRSVLYRRVRESNIEDFKRSYAPTYESHVQVSRFSYANRWKFFVPDLEEVWEFCRELPQFGSIAEIGQGFQFRSQDPQFPESIITESNTPLDGLVEGFARLRQALQTHQQPDKTWFNLDPQVIGPPRHGTTIGIPQILLNYARVSRESWRLKAFLDKEGHPVTSRFLVIRPHDKGWPLEALWGICNSPFANAYSYAFSTKRDILAGLMRKMPTPDINSVDPTLLVEAVNAYLKVAPTQEDGSLSPHTLDKLKILHWRIDAEVLRLYGLPPHLERQLLGLFSVVKRRGVPFEQKEYFPEGFTEISTLSELLAITVDWELTNERRTQLIEKKVKRNILVEEKYELDYLQQLTDARIELLAPLPIKQLEELREELQRRGIWEGE